MIFQTRSTDYREEYTMKEKSDGFRGQIGSNISQSRIEVEENILRLPILIVSHRKSTMQVADEVYYLIH